MMAPRKSHHFAQLRHQHGYATASFDCLYGDTMDFLSDKGYAHLVISVDLLNVPHRTHP